MRTLGLIVDVAAISDRRSGWLNLLRKYWVLITRSVIKSATFRPHIVHAHYLFPTGAIGMVAARIMRARLIITCHGSDVLLGERFPQLKPVLYRILKASDRIIVVSEEGRRAVIRNYGLDPGSVEVIDMGVDTGRFALPPEVREMTRRELGVGESGRIILFVGHLVPRKNVRALIEALKFLDAQVRLVIAGEGAERPRLEARAEQLGLTERVEFLRAVLPEEVPHLMAAADVFALPSLYEGRPVALLEAFASGLPVAASPAGGIPELIRNGVNGFLADPDDPGAFASAMRSALNAPGSLREAGRRIADQHELRHMASRVVRVYKEVMVQGEMDG